MDRGAPGRGEEAEKGDTSLVSERKKKAARRQRGDGSREEENKEMGGAVAAPDFTLK